MESNVSISSAKTDSTRRNSEEKDEGKLITPKEVKKERLRSLDAFRGLNILLMIFVNYGGGGYWYFSHAVWNGLYITDLIFPWFIFIMGTSLGLGISSLVKKEVDPVEGLWGIIWRSVKLFAVGIMYNTKSSNDLENIRMTGVLQRLAMVYFITAIVHYAGESLQCCMRSRGTVSRWRHILSDLAPYFGEWITMLVIIGIYCYFTYWFAVPGCEAGYVGPGGLHRDGAHAGCTGGAALYIDLKVYTMRHIYQWPDIRTIYQTDSAFDPEGLLGTLTSIFLCFLGLQAGKILVCHKGHRERLVRWLIWAIITGGIGTLLCKAQLEDGWVPINKNIMSISFVLVSAGTGFIMLSVMYILIDSWKLWNGQPFTYAGMNSIVLYMCHSIFQGYFPVSWQMPDMTQHWQLLLLHTWGTAFWAIIAYAMYKKKVFISL
ncbi:hypothetical protein CAPTEDRAFT_92095 [Capitella teleta]|uniref:Heparan-alpha-glucosaminide N-acetyltransferase catalytic domain-containing protein n=1 Tax=Capitella teleta TaxID=283909 RepID=R7TX02_CAPTE|nr:hypothetical protein CAPTEDRAFT_92095 [Capitella teleta]|eukprot:ELT95966.1 hypothetical protein CAPTEDRAFT_92095 [Capitella teleta]